MYSFIYFNNRANGYSFSFVINESPSLESDGKSQVHTFLFLVLCHLAVIDGNLLLMT